MEEVLRSAIFELQSQKNGKATIDDITQEWIDNAITEYQCLVINDVTIDGKKIKMTKDGISGTFIIDFNLNVEEIQALEEFYYEIVGVFENNLKILIHVKNEVQGISRIEFPDMDAIIINKNRMTEKAIDYEIEYDKEYKIKIQLEDGSEKELKIIEYKVEKPIIKVDTEWTNKDLTVEVDFGEINENVKKQISLDGGITYTTYTGPINLEKITTVKARTIGIGLQEEAELEIKNIDKLEPKEFTPTVSDLVSSTELEINANAIDAEATEEYGQSGIGRYQYYVYDGETLIDSSEIISNGRWTVSGLTVGNTYDIYVEVYDKAGNFKKSKKLNYTKLEVYVWEKYSVKEVFDKYKLNVSSNLSTIVRDAGNVVNSNYAYFDRYIFRESTGITLYSSDTIHSWFSSSYIFNYGSKYYRFHSYSSSTFPYLYKWSGYECSAEPIYRKVKGDKSYGDVTSNNSEAYPINGYEGIYWYVKK